MNTVTLINPATATHDAMRTWIAATSRALATLLHGAPTVAALRDVAQSVGYPSLRAAIADDRECVTKLAEVATTHGLLPAAILARDLPKDPIIGAFITGQPHRKAFLVKHDPDSKESYMMMHAGGAHVGDHFPYDKGSIYAAMSHPHLTYLLFDTTRELFAWLALDEVTAWPPEPIAPFDDGEEDEGEED